MQNSKHDLFTYGYLWSHGITSVKSCGIFARISATENAKWVQSAVLIFYTPNQTHPGVCPSPTTQFRNNEKLLWVENQPLHIQLMWWDWSNSVLRYQWPFLKRAAHVLAFWKPSLSEFLILLLITAGSFNFLDSSRVLFRTKRTSCSSPGRAVSACRAPSC